MTNKTVLNKNFKSIILTILSIIVVLIGTGLVARSIYARPNIAQLFLQTIGTVSAVDLTAKTVTVSYLQPASACSPSFCPKGRAPDVLRQGGVLVVNSQDGVENDITKMKVGDKVIVYLLQYSGNTTFQSNTYAIPYAAKDFNLLPANCDSGTICSSAPLR